jgi:hypothetical protein
MDKQNIHYEPHFHSQWDEAHRQELSRQQHNLSLFTSLLNVAGVKADPVEAFEQLIIKGMVIRQGHKFYLPHTGVMPRYNKLTCIEVVLHETENVMYTIKGDTYEYNVPSDSLFRIYRDIKQLPPPLKSTIMKTKTIEKKPEIQARIEFIRYSDKAFAIFGDTKPLKDKLKEMGCKFNPFLKYNGEPRKGWIVSAKKEQLVREFLELS